MCSSWSSRSAGNVSGVSRGRKFVKPLVAALGVAGTVASIWWFALEAPSQALCRIPLGIGALSAGRAP